MAAMLSYSLHSLSRVFPKFGKTLHNYNFNTPILFILHRYYNEGVVCKIVTLTVRVVSKKCSI